MSAGRGPWRRWADVLAYVFIAAIGVFWLATTRAGTPWGDDWAMYVHHAKNLAEGHRYDDTGFIYNPLYPLHAPRMYPPGFPLLLAPVYAWFGLDLGALKVPAIVCFVLSLFILVTYYRRHQSRLTAWLVVMGVGLNPYAWEFKDSILSELPFMFLVLLCALMIDVDPAPGDGTLLRHVATGAAIYAAYCVRPLGALFVPAILARDLLVRRSISCGAWVIGATFLAGALTQFALLPGDTGYIRAALYQPHASVADVGRGIGVRLAAYHHVAAHLLAPANWPSAAKRRFSELFVLLALAGMGARMARRLSPVELFVGLYVGAVLFFPGIQSRYLLPVLPFAFGYAFGLLESVRRPVVRYGLIAVVVAPLAWFYAGAYRHAEWREIAHGVQEVPAQDLFAYVRDHTPTGAVFMSTKPRALSLYTHRRAAAYGVPLDPERLAADMRSIGARYIVTGIADPTGETARWVAENPERFRLIYANERFRLYEADP